ncbi:MULTISPECIES: TetR/AcrR family transcriptional regulator [Staphylococcus]|uniref:TetR/AcrR family transcriptional regulator n=1 Tax=Staphylococcus TaxID=1279 RepID=UPI000763FF0B|nr:MULTISPECIES: TetR/AcrR family transcriptional regulator [Staphylococcus]KXA46409.1 transcriptional regulator, TetR family [Staphylococcus simulans]OFM20614.1 hypothetical protein HMPREF2713_00125 [Staphylococcus sp. HMSC059E03]OFN22092.1 hypothetical protein HMPREF2603_12760 [Staphylococcus sp. HMSC055C03]OFV07701.1 hypothetical protein HMPREF3124_02855 [Staphylococcus sp. HMSC12H08]OHR54996.1 hypothetical protein HMPREF2798_05785 [Staphylococcus sp. HMSC070A03]
MDKRTKYTMEQIKSTLLDLLDTHSFETITVTMICEQTSISRRTFYNHFSDKFEVIDDIMNDYTQAMRQAASESTPENFKQGILNGFNFIHKNKVVFIKLYKSPVSNLFLTRLGSVITELVEPKLNHAYLQMHNISVQTILVFLTSAVLGIVIESVTKNVEDYTTKVEEIATLVKPYFKTKTI